MIMLFHSLVYILHLPRSFVAMGSLVSDLQVWTTTGSSPIPSGEEGVALNARAWSHGEGALTERGREGPPIETWVGVSSASPFVCKKKRGSQFRGPLSPSEVSFPHFGWKGGIALNENCEIPYQLTPFSFVSYTFLIRQAVASWCFPSVFEVRYSIPPTNRQSTCSCCYLLSFIFF